MTRIEELKSNGHFTMDGREYILTEQASFQSDPVSSTDDWTFDNYYSARAICPADEVDDDGYQKCYTIRWDILGDYNPEYEGEDCACDWSSPAAVNESGEYNVEDGCYF